VEPDKIKNADWTVHDPVRGSTDASGQYK
jgi:hypothetical protein